MSSEAITTWLEPLRPILDPQHEVDWPWLHAFSEALDAELAAHPVGAEIPAGPTRSHRLRMIRTTLAGWRHPGTTTTAFDGDGGHPAVVQLFAQFVCGYRDLDLRDSIELGHGRLLARHGSPHTHHRWIPRLRAGELAGIAITEPHGGSRPAATRTHAAAGPDGTWLVTGRKTWISRLTEAAVFVVFFRDPHGRLAAAAVDATAPGLRRQPIPPTGLAGWTWGILDLDAVPVHPKDLLNGEGMVLLRRHFAAYRPLVTATALGGAAAVFDTVTRTLADRQASGDLERPRDSALITIGRSHAQLITALLGAAVAARLAATGSEQAERWACAMKAHGVDTAHQAAAELALLVGAAGFRADSQIAKTRRDLGGLLYADGIHDSLYRTAGKHHTHASPVVPPQPRGVSTPPYR